MSRPSPRGVRRQRVRAKPFANALDLNLILVQGLMAGQSWPYVWIGRGDTALGTIEWPELVRLAEVIRRGRLPRAPRKAARR